MQGIDFNIYYQRELTVSCQYLDGYLYFGITRIHGKDKFSKKQGRKIARRNLAMLYDYIDYDVLYSIEKKVEKRTLISFHLIRAFRVTVDEFLEKMFDNGSIWYIIKKYNIEEKLKFVDAFSRYPNRVVNRYLCKKIESIKNDIKPSLSLAYPEKYNPDFSADNLYLKCWM